MKNIKKTRTSIREEIVYEQSKENGWIEQQRD